MSNYESKIPENFTLELTIEDCSMVSNNVNIEYPFNLKVSMSIDDIFIASTDGLVRKQLDEDKYFINFRHSYKDNGEDVNRFEFSSSLFKGVFDSFNKMMTNGKRNATYTYINGKWKTVQIEHSNISDALFNLKEINSEPESIEKSIKTKQKIFSNYLES